LKILRKLIGPVAITGLLLVALVAAACDDDDGADGGGGDLDVIAAINILDNAGLHGIDESINNETTVPPTARTVAQKLETTVKLTAWPEDLRDEADALAKTFEDLAAVLDSESPDMARAGQLAAQAHDEEHDFSHAVWEHLHEKSGVSSRSEGDSGHD
jgi:hypothetical protein